MVIVMVAPMRSTLFAIRLLGAGTADHRPCKQMRMRLTDGRLTLRTTLGGLLITPVRKEKACSFLTCAHYLPSA
jgi:hypothetical protein